MSDSKRAAKPVIEFQNEWAALTEAIGRLQTDPYEAKYLRDQELIDNQTIKEVVPKVLKAYVDLFAMSQVLADEYERLVKKKQGLALPSGLVLPPK